MTQDQSYLYLGGKGTALQIRKDDGAFVKHFEVGQFAPADVPEAVYDPDVAADGLLYVPTAWSVRGDSIILRGAVYCFDTETGEQQWALEIPSHRWTHSGIPDSIWADVDASGAVVEGDRVIVTTTSQVLALDRHTGEIVWEQQISPADAGFWVGPTVKDSAVYAAGVTRYVYKLNASTGQTQWRVRVEGSLTPIIVKQDNRVYFTDDAWGELWVLDDENGEPIWHGRPPNYPQTRELYFSPVGVGEQHMVVVGDQYVYGLTKP